MRKGHHIIKLIGAWATAVVFLLPGTLRADGLPDLGDSARVDLSPALEQKLGDSAMRDIRWNDPSYLNDPEVAAYINRIGQRLVSAETVGGQGFSFFVLRDPTINAFAMPGGYIGVHTATLLACRSESELAGVLAHEISHVTQHHIARMVGTQKEASLMALAGLLVAVLAARSNSQISQAAITAGNAAGIQTQLNYSRDFEREADRLGLARMEAAGFDVRGMGSFFERLQRDTRLYENNAPAYLQSHPLTTERIADMENRIGRMPYRQVPDTLQFDLVQAKLRVSQGIPSEQVAAFRDEIAQKKQGLEVVARYGLCRALLADGKPEEASRELARLRSLQFDSPMFDTLEAEIELAQKNSPGAIATYRRGLGKHPHDKALVYGLADLLLANGDPTAEVTLVEKELARNPRDADLYALQGRGYGALGKRLLQHRARAELYALQGRTKDAIEQLELAQRAGDGNFYELSAVDARLRELKKQDREATRDADSSGH